MSERRLTALRLRASSGSKVLAGGVEDLVSEFDVVAFDPYRVRTPVTLGSRFGDWHVTWLGGWSRYRLYYLVMVVKLEPRRITAAGSPARVKNRRGTWATPSWRFDPALGYSSGMTSVSLRHFRAQRQRSVRLYDREVASLGHKAIAGAQPSGIPTDARRALQDPTDFVIDLFEIRG